ncbi:hypothetical protein [Dyella silvae]|uniref:hypothetical protein n=1 Tax=Dyella silvae TaxID=2994424 RepID=UPI002263DBB1|nr:hypothetical protein [Dyella silvae]
MGRVSRFYALIIVVLLALYAAIGFYVLHPAASVAYSQYFLSGEQAASTHR